MSIDLLDHDPLHRIEANSFAVIDSQSPQNARAERASLPVSEKKMSNAASSPSMIKSCQLLACHRHGDWAVPYMARASSYFTAGGRPSTLRSNIVSPTPEDNSNPYRIPSESVAMNSSTVHTKSRRPSHSEGPRPCKVAGPLMPLLFPTCKLVEPRPDSAVAAAPPPGCCWICCSHSFPNHVDPSLPRLQTRHPAAPVTIA